MLSVGKSLRASSDREIVNHAIARDGGHVHALGVFNNGPESVRAQFDLNIAAAQNDNFSRLNAQTKEWRINGVKVTPVDFVGRANVVIFEASDLELALGAAAVRRRYLDILIGQFDTEYLQALIRLNRVRNSRNALLRGSVDVQDFDDEIAFWDGRFCDESTKIIQTRREVMQILQTRAAPIHSQLSEGETLALTYLPNFGSANLATEAQQLTGSDLRNHIYTVDGIKAARAIIRPHGNRAASRRLPNRHRRRTVKKIRLSRTGAHRRALTPPSRSIASLRIRQTRPHNRIRRRVVRDGQHQTRHNLRPRGAIRTNSPNRDGRRIDRSQQIERRAGIPSSAGECEFDQLIVQDPNAITLTTATLAKIRFAPLSVQFSEYSIQSFQA